MSSSSNFRTNYQFLRDYFPNSIELIKALKEGGYLSFLEKWPAPPLGKEEKILLFSNLVNFDRVYPGLVDYLEEAKELLNKPLSKISSNIEPPPLLKAQVELSDESINNTVKHLNKVALVLVAGGLGQRLLGNKLSEQDSNNQIKLALTSNIFYQKSFLEQYAGLIHYLQHLYKRLTHETLELPLIIMTSDETHVLLQEYLKENDYFQLDPGQYTLIKQVSGPGIKNFQAELAVETKEISSKVGSKEKFETRLPFLPLGHGNIHYLLHHSGLTGDLARKGIEHLFFFQDTHLQVKNIFLSSLATWLNNNNDFAFITVKRRPGENLGVILRDLDDHRVKNLEYNLLPEDQQSLTALPANTNAFWVRIVPYLKILKETAGSVNAFINPKTDLEGNFLTPTRVESLMQDISLYFPANHVAAYDYPRTVAFAPLKHSILDLIQKPTSNPMTAVELEESEFAYHRSRLQNENENENVFTDLEIVEGGKEILFQHFEQDQSAKVIFENLSVNELKFLKTTLHPNSLLISEVPLAMKNVSIANSSALIITKEYKVEQAKVEIEELNFDRPGFEVKYFQPGSDQMNASNTSNRGLQANFYNKKLRGYTVNWQEPYRFQITENGHYRINSSFELVKID